MKFPTNPSNGMIIETLPGVFYQFEARQKQWTHLQGLNAQFDLSTPLRDGLMSSKDLKKLHGLLVPPPNTSMTSTGCGFTFEKGIFGFRSSNEDLHIEHELIVIDKNEKGFNVNKKQLWKIHENTYGINFKINVEKLIDELEAHDHLAYRKTIGLQGLQGDRGDNGLDNIETGPNGDPGDNGANLPFLGSLLSEQNEFETDQVNRGIVDIYTEAVSLDENYLVVTRANLSEPDFCPKFIKPTNLSSKWITVIDERQAIKKILRECETETCGVRLCGKDQTGIQVIQTFCSTRLYYLDFEPIETSIQQKFEELLLEMRQAKEKLVTSWLNTMIEIYNEQKLALCCAIENCESRRENMRHRSRIEDIRVHAAIGGLGVGLSKDISDRIITSTNVNKPCAKQDDSGQVLEPPPGSSIIAPEFKLAVSCSANAPDIAQAATIDLPAGTYDVSISNCCCYSIHEIPGLPFIFNMVAVNETVWRSIADGSHVAPDLLPAVQQNKPYSSEVRIIFIDNGKESTQTLGSGVRVNSNDLAISAAEQKLTLHHDGGTLKAFVPLTSDVAKHDAGIKAITHGPLNPNITPTTGNEGTIELTFTAHPEEKIAAALEILESSAPNCLQSLIEVIIDCKKNNSLSNAIEVALEPGEYVAKIIDCCCSGVSGKFAGKIFISYDINEIKKELITNADFGASIEGQAFSDYVDTNIPFKHFGTVIQLYADSLDGQNIGGSIRVQIQTKVCFDQENNNAVSSPDATHDLDLSITCDMPIQQIKQYEFAWNTNNCCGFSIHFGGVQWIVVKRSLDIDMSCGGGESENAPCIQESLAVGEYPAIAFPTIDGKKFLGMPTSGFRRMFRDNQLESDLLSNMRKGDFAQIKTRNGFGSEADKIISGPISNNSDLVSEIANTFGLEFGVILFPFEL